MRKYILILLASLCMLTACTPKGSTQITDLTVNDKPSPLGIDENPYFSWKMEDSKEGQLQTAYQILVSDTKEALEKGDYVWDSGKVESGFSVAIPYEGAALEAEKHYFWKVRVWGKDAKEILSETADFEMGKLDNEWENTEWITAPDVQKLPKENCAVISQINYDFKMEQAKTAFVWGAKESGYGEHYRCAFDVSGGQVLLTFDHMDGEKVLSTEAEAVLTEDVESFIAGEHHVSIGIQEGYAQVAVDDVLVLENIAITDSSVGEIGFWVVRSDNKAWYDNILIQGQDGTLLYQEDFEQSSNIFAPYYIKVENGWGRADAGFVVTPGTEVPAPMFRKVFTTEEGKEIESVRLYASSLGIYDIYVNGEDVNPFYGAPGQSVYSEEVYYQTYDLTEAVSDGENAIGIMLGHGRYDRAKGDWGDKLALCAQLVIRYKDGTRQVVGTDDTWSVCADGPIRNDDIYLGEYYDASYEQEDWTTAAFEEVKNDVWVEAEVCTEETDVIKRAMPDNGVKCLETFQPITVTEPIAGTYVYDFGKNFNGICRLQLTGKAGDTVTMRYAEYLNSEELLQPDDENGTIWTRNLDTADNTDYYTFKEDGTITYVPTFSYRGFQYLQITGVEKAPALEEVEGLLLATDNARSGEFECSDETLNKLYNTIYLAQLSNYVDIPTDCPQRDERLGWTGDAQVFAYTGSLNAYTANFMYKYLDALRVSQNEDGSYLQITPYVDRTGGANGWSDAGVIIVWEMYQQYGNKQVIEENLSAMCRYVDYLVSTSNNFVREQQNYNDHNATSYMEDACCNTAQCTCVAGLVAKMCDIAGEKELHETYKAIYEKYLESWRTNFLREDGSIGNWLPSEYVIGLAYGLYPEELEMSGAEKLKISVEASGYHMTTGYITTPHILSTLCKYGYVEDAYKMLQQTGYPSYNYMFEQGTTGLTEGWHTISVNEEGKKIINGSLNHVALGAVGQWFYTDVLGIRRDEEQPAYKHFFLEPQVGGGLTYAKGSYDSIYGKIESAWEVTEKGMEFHFVIPANTSATVTLPTEEYREMELSAGEYDFIVPKE